MLIEKISGRVAYVVVSFRGFLGLAHSHYPIPWSALKYDTSLGGYRTGITEAQLRDAPEFSDDFGPIALGRRRRISTTAPPPTGKVRQLVWALEPPAYQCRPLSKLGRASQVSFSAVAIDSTPRVAGRRSSSSNASREEAAKRVAEVSVFLRCTISTNGLV